MMDRLRNSEANARRIANVEAGFGSSGSFLQIPGRVLVGEGVLVKICSIIISKKRYNKQHLIPLEEVKLESLDDVGDSKHGWLIKTRTKSFAVYAATEDEKQEWMLHIDRCVQDLLNNGRVAPTDHAAVWVPDGEATKCMCCRSTQFSVIQRRHHCRACGSVVCRGCSSKNFLLEGISKKPVKVCNTCYNKLCQGMNTTPNKDISVLSLNNNDDNDSSENSDEEYQEKFEAPRFYGRSSSQSDQVNSKTSLNFNVSDKSNEVDSSTIVQSAKNKENDFQNLDEKF